MRKYSFLEELLILGKIGDHCRSLRVLPLSKTISLGSESPAPDPWPLTRSYWDVPDYMKVAFHSGKGKDFERSVALYEGSYINLDLYGDLNDFLKRKLSSNRISKLRAYKRNLERVFPIEYAHYYGEELSDSTYSMLMDSLKAMISTRFEEKKMEHTALEDWDNFKNRGKGLIADKRAALIVIYNDGQPIHISFNYVWEKLVFGYVRGYNLDYSKFYLGFIDIMIQLEWCFNNEFHIYDLLRGNLDYKLMFADGTYLYRSHFLVPSPLRNPQSLLPWLRTLLKFDIYYPLRTKMGTVYRRMFPMSKKQINRAPFYQFDEPSPDESSLLAGNQMVKISLEPEPRENFKRAAYHFLYNSKTPLKDLEVYMLPNQRDVYFLKGNGKSKKLGFTNVENRDRKP